MFALYNEIIYRPILNLLVWLYNTVPGHDLGIAIVLVTAAIRLILAPFLSKSIESQKAMQALQPKLNDLREKHKDDKEAQGRAMMELYREHKVNPVGSCLPVLFQLPVLIALYQVLIKALHGNLEGLYAHVFNPGTLNPLFLKTLDLSKASIILAVLAGVLQYVQTKMMLPKEESSDTTTRLMNKQALYMFPAITVFIAWKLPAGLPLYWVVNTLVTIAQQWYISRKSKPQA